MKIKESSSLFKNLLALLRVVKVEQERKMNVQLGEGLTGISLRAAVQARMVLALAESPGLVCTGVGP